MEGFETHMHGSDVLLQQTGADLTVRGPPCPLYHTQPAVTGSAQPSFPHAASWLMNLERWQLCLESPATQWDRSHTAKHCGASNDSFFSDDDRPERALVIWPETNLLWNKLRGREECVWSRPEDNMSALDKCSWGHVTDKDPMFNAHVAC